MNNPVGTSVWFDLPAADPHDAMAFYEGLFGWKFKVMRDPAPSGYWIIHQGDAAIGGLRQAPSVPLVEAGQAPLIYFTVDHMATHVARARELGAKLAGDRVELGQDRGCYQWLRDRQNNLIGFWAPN